MKLKFYGRLVLLTVYCALECGHEAPGTNILHQVFAVFVRYFIRARGGE